jgi:hypothetical protein
MSIHAVRDKFSGKSLQESALSTNRCAIGLVIDNDVKST